MNKYVYNSWPIGQVPENLQRPELKKLKELGYKFDDPREVVDIFEQKLAEFSGCKYVVSCDCCTNGIFLSLKYLQLTSDVQTVTIPKRTYISIPMQIIHAGMVVEFEDISWSGIYQLKPFKLYDGAVRFTKGMYIGEETIQVVSFQIKKRIPIGRGGAILTNSKETYDWLKLASYDGRNLTTPYTDKTHVKMLGYHMYMTPEDAARGLLLMESIPEENEDTGSHLTYTDISHYFKTKNGRTNFKTE